MKGKKHIESAAIREEMKAFKAEGHTVKEVAEKFGYSIHYTQSICKGIAPQFTRRPEHYRNQYTSGKFDREENARKLIGKRADGFEYVGGFTGADGYVNVRCNVCGTVQKRSLITIRHKHIRCEKCEEARLLQKAERLKQEKAYKDQQTLDARKHRKVVELTAQILKTKLVQCVECGKVFATTKSNAVCCSSACTKHKANRRHDRRLKGKRVDKDITVKKLFDRDKGICWICGKTCNLQDYKTVDGTMITGDDYPSIDHIVPVCQGGLDAWENVKLAHRLCNMRRFVGEKHAPVM